MRWTVIISALAALASAPWANAHGYRVEYAFKGAGDAAAPQAGLLEFGGKLYGTASGGADNMGAVYSFDPASGAETVVYSFGNPPDGVGPGGGLIAVRGLFYGTTIGGGASGLGAVFSLDPASGAERVVYAFKGGGDGVNPYSSLTRVGGLLYGTTALGGSANCISDCGTVFSVDPATGAEAVVYAFKGGADGEHPHGGLIDVGGVLYGTTEQGGLANCSAGCGTVFSLDPATGVKRLIYAFTGGADGALPAGGLIKVGGALYGTTSEGPCQGGASPCGAVFRLDPANGAVKVVYGFRGRTDDGRDGAGPLGNLVGIGGALYGATEVGGRGRGTVFRLDPATGAETVLHIFHRQSGGALPEAGLTYANHRLYGTTVEGGGSANCRRGCGTVFSISP